MFLVIGFAALGLFPNYYSFTQEWTISGHQGKLTGALGCICWLAMSLLHEVVGDSINKVRTGSLYHQRRGRRISAVVGSRGTRALFWGKTVVAASQLVSVEGGFAPKLNGEAIQPSVAVGVQK